MKELSIYLKESQLGKKFYLGLFKWNDYGDEDWVCITGPYNTYESAKSVFNNIEDGWTDGYEGWRVDVLACKNNKLYPIFEKNGELSVLEYPYVPNGLKYQTLVTEKEFIQEIEKM